MVAYLKSLGLDPDYKAPENDSRQVVVKSITIEFKEHEPQTLEFETEPNSTETKLKVSQGLVIKEGCQFRMKVTFRVQHKLVHGFKIRSTVKKLGSKVII